MKKDYAIAEEKAKTPTFVASHDSATGMLLSLSNFLHGKPFGGLETVPTNEFYARAINSIPPSWRQKLYTWSGKLAAIPYRKAGEIDAGEIDQWVCDSYPKRKYPAIAIGSCNGAVIHLCAALGIPWLPQTFLVPIDKEKDFPVDEPEKTIKWAQEPGEQFLESNPDWQLHHMMDPNQDRLRVRSIGYFRIKKLKLGSHYRKFLEERLSPGGTILIIDCDYKWPVKKMGSRHFFQLGGYGGLKPEEYYYGSTKVENFLAEAGSNVRSWEVPAPDTEMPEAEWGLDRTFLREIEDFAAEENLSGTTISFNHPQKISAPIADLYRWWYNKQEFSSSRLLVETFNVISPLLCLKKRCVPYWLAFNVDESADDLENYLENREQMNEIYMMILSHAKRSTGYTSASRWRSLMKKARLRSEFIGTRPDKYPIDLAMFARYSKELQKKIEDEHPLPSPLELGKALELLKEYGKGRIRISNFKEHTN